jgi:hypothetical protein
VHQGISNDSDLQITSTCFIFTLAGQPFCNMQRLWETIPARGVITSVVSNGVKVNFEPILQGYPVMLTHGDAISIQSATASHTWQFSANEAEFIVCASYTPFVGEAVHLLSREDKLEQLLAIFDDPAPSCDGSASSQPATMEASSPEPLSTGDAAKLEPPEAGATSE